MKKSETMMESFNTLFKNWGQIFSENTLDSKDRNLNYNKYQFNKRNNESEELLPEKKKKNFEAFKNSNDAYSNSDGPLFNGYLKISSKLFELPSLFPFIRIIDEKGQESTVSVKTDNEYYRINENPLSKENTLKLDKTDFYFTLTKNHFYYKINDKDINVLQTFDIKNFKIKELGDEFLLDNTPLSCFELKENKTNYNYKICGKDMKILRNAMCTYAKLTQTQVLSCNKNENANVSSSLIEEIIEEKSIFIPLPSKNCNDNWNYINHGDDWECLCKEGIFQSPIDLPDTTEAILSPVTPLFQFEEVSAKTSFTTIDGEIKANSYIKMKLFKGALRIMHPNLGKIITLNGAVYKGEEISIHTPSEHTIKGKKYDMEIQITFYGKSKGDIAKQIVLSFLFEKKPGYYNKFIDDLDFYNLPNKDLLEKNIINNIFIPNILLSSTENTPNEIPDMKPFSFYTYDGSLTMPPCSEDTIHYVASEPIPIGSVVLDLAREALKIPDIDQIENRAKAVIEKSFNNEIIENYRNTQNLNDRSVFYFDHKLYRRENIVNIIPKKLNYSKWHYEKKKIKTEVFIHVKGKNPSNIPGSSVLSEKEARDLINVQEFE